MVILISIVIVLSSLSTALIYGLFISSKKIDAYEKFILDRSEAYKGLLYRIRDLDQKEMFEKDDEVGVIFSEIKDEIEEFQKIIE